MAKSHGTVPGLALRLRMAREQAGLTQEQLAASCGISRAQIANYETEQAYPSLPALVALADALGRTTDWLLRRSRNPLREGIARIEHMAQTGQAFGESRGPNSALQQIIDEARRLLMLEVGA